MIRLLSNDQSSFSDVRVVVEIGPGKDSDGRLKRQDARTGLYCGNTYDSYRNATRAYKLRQEYEQPVGGVREIRRSNRILIYSYKHQYANAASVSKRTDYFPYPAK